MSPDRSAFAASDVVRDIWHSLELPDKALSSLKLDGHVGAVLPSSFKLGVLAQGSIALSALTAALLRSLRSSPSSRQSTIPLVTVPLRHAAAEFRSEQLYTVNGTRPATLWGPIGGLHKTRDGYVRIHDGFPHHRDGILALLGLHNDATREDVSRMTVQWKALELENVALDKGLALYALRSYKEWDQLEQARILEKEASPIRLQKVKSGIPTSPPVFLSPPSETGIDKVRCLQGIRVLELSRVIAGPVAGRALAAHGADVLWITSPNLPALPDVDIDTARGKRTVQLDLDRSEDRDKLWELIHDCDVFLQSYRPGSLAARGFSPRAVSQASKRGVVYANLSAFGPEGSWAGRRGFDSLVQMCSGMNVSEAEHAGKGETARPTPVQALDHGAGYLLAAGIMAALWKRESEGGSWNVDVSLASVMTYLRSLGQYPSDTGFIGAVMAGDNPRDDHEFFEMRQTQLDMLKAVRHSATIENCRVGWDNMPKRLGSDTADWLPSN
jgi:hypothetical protein